jgi:alkanesulfonate monooxygenase SsuD/methylene tetrahydromethanopterin reductase-like flavin-dependent oxidoreductase (luciferase family)
VGVTLALNATEQIPVGTSIVSAMTRHPAILAMEIAGISRAFPGRVGTPREVADKVLHWVAAGIDAIAVFLPHPSELDTLTLLAQEVIPLVAQSQEGRG